MSMIKTRSLLFTIRQTASLSDARGPVRFYSIWYWFVARRQVFRLRGWFCRCFHWQCSSAISQPLIRSCYVNVHLFDVAREKNERERERERKCNHLIFTVVGIIVNVIILNSW